MKKGNTLFWAISTIVILILFLGAIWHHSTSNAGLLFVILVFAALEFESSYEYEEKDRRDIYCCAQTFVDRLEEKTVISSIVNNIRAHSEAEAIDIYNGENQLILASDYERSELKVSCIKIS